MMLKHYLLTPGSDAGPRARDAGDGAADRPSPHARLRAPSSSEAAEGLQWIFQTRQPVLMLSGSGTLAMEAAVVNTMKRGDKALCVVGGKFGERWRNICKAHGIEFVSLDVEWGQAVDPAGGRRRRSTPTTRSPPSSRRPTSRRRACAIRSRRSPRSPRRASGVINVVDAVSALGAFDLPMDARRLRRAAHRLAEGAHAAAGTGVHRAVGQGVGAHRVGRSAALLRRPQAREEGAGRRRDARGRRRSRSPSASSRRCA